MYDIESQQVSSHRLSVNFSSGGSYIETGRNALLCVGGFNSPAVYSLDYFSCQLSPLPSLFTRRAEAGLAKFNARFYVFGGHCRERLNSCERMRLSDHHWTQISSMKYPRDSFTPCQFRALIYLPCAYVKAMETFNAETETFAVLPVSLPSLHQGNSSVAFVANGELCLLTTGKQMVRWKIETEREFRLSNTNRPCWSTQQPLIVDSLAFIAYMGKVQKFSLNTYSFLS